MSVRENIPAPVRRAALYIRVSTDEQARHGYSLGAQKEDLEEYAKRHGYAIVDYYIDGCVIIGLTRQTLTASGVAAF